MIIKLSNGKEIVLDDVVKDPKAEAIKWLRDRKENRMEPEIEVLDCTGVKAIFTDGAEVILTAQGLFPCSVCKAMQCKHFHAALPHWNRFKWETAERGDCPWGNTLLKGIGIDPPYIVQPALVYKQTRWAPFGKGEEVAQGVRVWHTKHGKLYHFWDNGRRLSNRERIPDGHVYIGPDHPDRHTPCLICRDGCGHVARALRLEAEYA